MMKLEEIAADAIYVGDGILSDVPGYIYIRGFVDGEIGFSVLDDPCEEPDFSSCGVFWVPPEVFAESMKIFSGAGSVRIPKARDYEYC